MEKLGNSDGSVRSSLSNFVAAGGSLFAFSLIARLDAPAIQVDFTLALSVSDVTCSLI